MAVDNAQFEAILFAAIMITTLIVLFIVAGMGAVDSIVLAATAFIALRLIIRRVSKT